MHFEETNLCGAWLIDLAPTRDHRGFFARTFCVQAYADHGLTTGFVQHSISQSVARGTLRGMHFQRPPRSEVKVVRCLKGAIWDVIIDLRAELSDLPPLAGFRAHGGQSAPALRPGGLRPWFPDPLRRHAGELPHLRVLRAAGGERGALRRPGVRH